MTKKGLPVHSSDYKSLETKSRPTVAPLLRPLCPKETPLPKEAIKTIIVVTTTTTITCQETTKNPVESLKEVSLLLHLRLLLLPLFHCQTKSYEEVTSLLSLPATTKNPLINSITLLPRTTCNFLVSHPPSRCLLEKEKIKTRIRVNLTVSTIGRHVDKCFRFLLPYSCNPLLDSFLKMQTQSVLSRSG